jgi:rSAM/selenodomain-associated transferase 1
MLEVAILARAPVPGFAKTRLIPALGLDGAAHLQRRLMERAVRTAIEARIGPVTLWCTPDAEHEAFAAIAARFDLTLAVQAPGDLGDRMLAGFEAASPRGAVLIGTDCPALDARDLRDAADLLADGTEVVIAPVEDGGYGLVAAWKPLPVLFREMPWSTPWVASLTRDRAAAAQLKLAELRTLWDVDTPADYRRLVEAGLLWNERVVMG